MKRKGLSLAMLGLGITCVMTDSILSRSAPSMTIRTAQTNQENGPAIPLNSLPGKGLAQHPFLYCGQSDSRKPVQTLYIIRDGKVAWSYSLSERDNHFVDATLLSNGDVIFARKHGVTEVTPQKEIAWNYDGTARHRNPLGPANRQGQDFVHAVWQPGSTHSDEQTDRQGRKRTGSDNAQAR